MSTEFFNDQWRIPSNENQNKVSNYSCEFDGSSDFIDCGDSDKFSFGNGTTDRPFSFSGWVKPADSSSVFPLVSKVNPTGDNREYQFSRGNSKLTITLNSLGTYSNRIEVETTASITSTDWQHWVTTYDGAGSGAGIKFYVNGVEMTTSVSSYGTYVAMENGTASLEIGAITNSSPSGKFANGKIDQVSIFDYALSATEVSTLYGGGTAITNPMSLSPKPISYYQLGDQSVDNGANYLVPNNSLSDYVFSFDGTDDYIDCGNITALNSQSAFSTSAWINYSGTPAFTSHIILSGGGSATNRFWIQLISSTKIRYGSGSASAYDVTVSTVSSGTWYHIATVHNGTSLDIYINGIKQGATITVVAPSTQIGNNFKIGEYFSPVGYLWNGQLSNVAVFNTVLSTANIETIYNNGAPNDISSLSPTAWYKLNAADTFDGSDWTINDYGSGGNDGTSSGMTSANLVVSDLQQTSGYSPYALDFDGVDDYLDCGDSDVFSFGNGSTDSPFSISAWVNMTDATSFVTIAKDATSNREYVIRTLSDDKLYFYLLDNVNGGYIGRVSSGTVTSYQGTWIHTVYTYNGNSSSSGIKIYLNGSPVDNTNYQGGSYTAMSNTTTSLNIGRQERGMGTYANGKISNAAIFNTELSSTQVTEIYNEGVPGNLHNFSGTAPVSWWQLGSNSSFNTNWTCLDEIGTNNAVSVNMTNSDIVDGPGYSASGVGTSSIDIKGDAPYSTANGLSNSMDVLDRTTDVPN